VEILVKRQGAEDVVVLAAARPLVDSAGRMQGATAVLHDITERRRGEALLQAALAEKEAALATNQTLLREVHHRVKNNLQVLCDMLYLQMEGLADEEKKAILRDTYGRIYAIARLHEQLYQSIASGQVQLPAYLGRLIEGFESLYAGAQIGLDVPDRRVALDVDRAIHVGLIVNELVTNALKHGFPSGEPGRVEVLLRRVGDQLELQVRDNGVGIPADFDLAQARSLGLRIVHILARRLDASVAIEREAGTRFSVTFPLHQDDEQEFRI
jgi:two-component sensor histidine kinase